MKEIELNLITNALWTWGHSTNKSLNKGWTETYIIIGSKSTLWMFWFFLNLLLIHEFVFVEQRHRTWIQHRRLLSKGRPKLNQTNKSKCKQLLIILMFIENWIWIFFMAILLDTFIFHVVFCVRQNYFALLSKFIWTQLGCLQFMNKLEQIM